MNDDSVGDAKTAPAASRNREPIAAVLRTWLPPKGLVLEVASGTGEHALWFSRALPGVTWQPSERDPVLLASIAAWRAAEGPNNLLPPVELDAATPETWALTQADAVVAINLIHIAPWDVTLGVMAGAGRVLTTGGVLFLYGPFIERGLVTVPSNVAFDLMLALWASRYRVVSSAFAGLAWTRVLESCKWCIH